MLSVFGERERSNCGYAYVHPLVSMNNREHYSRCSGASVECDAARCARAVARKRSLAAFEARRCHLRALSRGSPAPRKTCFPLLGCRKRKSIEQLQRLYVGWLTPTRQLCTCNYTFCSANYSGAGWPHALSTLSIMTLFPVYARQ